MRFLNLIVPENLAERIVANVSELSFHLQVELQLLKNEVLPLVTLSLFLGNLGAWLECGSA